MRGPKVSVGYWQDPESTARAPEGGRTGDVGMLDDEGYLYIVDRLKDMIVSGGENVASLEVERVLYEHAAVAEAAVVGRPTSAGRSAGGVRLVHEGAELEADELISFCVDRLAGFKTPKGVAFIDQLPRNPSGKVLKRELRELATREVPA